MYSCEWWTEYSDVLESNLTVQGVGCVNQEYCLGVAGVKGGSHGVHGSFDARNLSPAHLETAGGILDVGFHP